MLYVLPVTILGLALGREAGKSEFILIPDSFGYWSDHACASRSNATRAAVSLSPDGENSRPIAP